MKIATDAISHHGSTRKPSNNHAASVNAVPYAKADTASDRSNVGAPPCTGRVLGGLMAAVWQCSQNVNQLLRRPRSERAVFPLMVLVPWDPISLSARTRPPHSPYPLRSVTCSAL